MITTLFVNIISVFMGLVSAIMPSWRLPTYIISAFEDSLNVLYVFNGYFPVDACIKVGIIIFSFHITILTARLIFGLISIIRGGGKVEV